MIIIDRICDGIYDCIDAADERDCGEFESGWGWESKSRKKEPLLMLAVIFPPRHSGVLRGPVAVWGGSVYTSGHQVTLPDVLVVASLAVGR